MPGCRVAFAIGRAGTGLDDAVPQRYNLSMCAFKVLSSCPRDVSCRRQAAEHDILMRKWEAPLPCGLPSKGFLPLAGLLERHILRAHHPHTDADPASHRVCLWRGGSFCDPVCSLSAPCILIFHLKGVVNNLPSRAAALVAGAPRVQLRT